MNSLLSHIPYYQTHELAVTLGGQRFRVQSKPGLPHWDQIAPAIHLLAAVRPTGQILLLGCGPGALAVFFSRLCSVCLADTSLLALRMAEQTLKLNGMPDPRIATFPLAIEDFDAVVMALPKGRKLARRWLVEAHAALKPGGELYLAGANTEGIQPAIRDAEMLFGNVTILGYKKGNRLAKMVKTRQEMPTLGWASEPGIARGSWHEFDTSTRGMAFHLRSLPGVFSYDRLDEGTRLLVEALEVIPGERVLDFGCGYGIVGMVAARLGADDVDMVDSDLWAVASARENILINGIANSQAEPSDVLDAIGDRRYHLVVSNPPFHSGKNVEYAMSHAFITHAHHALLPGGRLVVVANKFIRYDRQMLAVFGNAEKLAETGKYHVLEATKA